MILLAGGSSDPNLWRLVSAATSLGVHFGVALAAQDSIRHVVGRAGVDVNGSHLTPSGAFVRFNVFGYEPHKDTAQWWAHHNWYTTMRDALGGVRQLNAAQSKTTKCKNLQVAAGCGFRIPQTVVADTAPFDGIAKPVHGGDLTRWVQAGERLPWGLGFCQPWACGPEYRLYFVGDSCWPFLVTSPSIDYREKQDATVTIASGLEDEIACGRQLMSRLGLEFCAIDMRDSDNGRLFLEVNDGPMFVAFDDVVQGAIGRSIINYLAA